MNRSFKRKAGTRGTGREPKGLGHEENVIANRERVLAGRERRNLQIRGAIRHMFGSSNAEIREIVGDIEHQHLTKDPVLGIVYELLRRRTSGDWKGLESARLEEVLERELHARFPGN